MQKIKCPNCGKRLLDIKTEPEGVITIEAKCLNCGKIVKVVWKPSGAEK